MKLDFDTLFHELDRPLRKLIELIKDELGGEIKTKFVGLQLKPYSCLTDASSEDKKQKPQKSVS